MEEVGDAGTNSTVTVGDVKMERTEVWDLTEDKTSIPG